ncbi:MAG TPA: hypothetical protein VG753_00680 [Candidatus Paceibacterota bacterium]|nr:hypothetical protein [Candidatus Paceibacterota bacterium]
MTRRIIYIIIGGVLLLALLLGLWFWFFGRGASDISSQSGLFGSAGDRTGAGTSGNTSGNGVAPIGSNAGTGVSGTGNGGANTQYVIPNTPTNALPIAYSTTSAGGSFQNPAWLGGTSGSGSTGSSINFTPTPINTVNNNTVSGNPYINVNNGDNTSSNGGNSFVNGLLGVAGSCLANFLAQQAGSGLTSAIGSLFGSALGQVQVTDPSTHANQQTDSIITCVTKALARAAIQQITNDTVNWINSGFDGQPAFVQDYNKFFGDISDEAAGSVIQSGDLAFLCSPFQLQVRIAIAQSYARRSQAPSCTLSDIAGNVQDFANGTFSEGGWQGLIAYTTDPSNNPYAGYMYGESVLQGQISTAKQNAVLQLSPGGFLSQQKCTTDSSGKKSCTIQTPGTVIESNLEQIFGKNIDQLELASSIDDILNALVNQIITKTLYKGLASLGNGQNGYGASLSSEDVNAEVQADSLINDIAQDVQYAQQYGATAQGSITDLQTAQGNLSTLEYCWLGKSSTGAAANAQAAGDQVTALEAQVDAYNNKIAAANSTIASLQDIQTQALNSASAADVANAQDAFDQLTASGNLITQTQVQSAGQDRTTLQAQMSSLNTTTNAQLQQCYAAS